MFNNCNQIDCFANNKNARILTILNLICASSVISILIKYSKAICFFICLLDIIVLLKPRSLPPNILNLRLS